jgi:hypothetical protein
MEADEADGGFDDPEHRFDAVFSFSVTLASIFCLQLGHHLDPPGFGDRTRRLVRGVLMGAFKKQRKAEKEARKAAGQAVSDSEGGRLSRKTYERELARLHVELVKLQQWVVHTKQKICVVFEGRDGAGKGGTIKAITERVSPRIFRVVALPAPTERERSQMYVQRYIPHLPAAGKSSFSTTVGTTARAWNAWWASALRTRRIISWRRHRRRNGRLSSPASC